MKDSPVEWCCTAIHPAGYVCTLNLGHKGGHVARGAGVVCAEWAAVPEHSGNDSIFESPTSKRENTVQVGDVVLAGRNAFRITGIYLGGVGTQNLVGLETLHKATGYAHGGAVKEMFVPEELVLTAGVYRRVD